MKVYRSNYQKKIYPALCSIDSLISWFLILLLFSACGGPKPHVADNPASQRFRDATRLFPIEKSSVAHASFLRANEDNLSDLAVLSKAKSELYILINKGKKGFLKKQAGQWTKNNKEEINFFATADLNRDGGDDLVLILGGRKTRNHKFFLIIKKVIFIQKKKRGGIHLHRV